MPGPSKWDYEEYNQTKPKLPALPPLVTTHSTPDRSRREREKSRFPIGWSQVDNNTATVNSSTSPIFSDFGATSPQSASSNRSKRRPPPPIPAASVSAGDLTFPASYTSPSSLSTTKTPVTSPTYKSPFVGEEELVSLPSVTNTPTKWFKSPFVGDSSVLVAGSYTREKTKWVTDVNDFPKAYNQNDDYNIDMMNSLKALPSLPIQTHKKPEFDAGKLHAKYGSSSDWNPTLSQDDYLNKPLRPFTNERRQGNDTRAISDSISSYYSNSNYAFNDEIVQHNSFDSIAGNRPLQQVPSVTVPMQPFSIDQLDENKLFQCYSVSLLSDVYEWLLKVYFEWFNECIFRKIEFYQMVQLLLEFQLPTSCDQDVVDSNVDKIIESLVYQGAVRFETDSEDSSNDEITFIVAGLVVQGVFTNLLACYSYEEKRSSAEQHTHCYCSRCPSKFMKQSRPVLKLSEIINKSVGFWSDYWKLSPDELSEINPREVNRQSFIFDLIILEERSLNLAHAAIQIYGKRFHSSLLPNDSNFRKIAFDLFEPMINVHKEFLLTPIFWKLKSQGKFIDGVGKIYLQWCNASRELYIQYAEVMATVHEIINWEKDHDTIFSQWLRQIDDSPEISRSKLYHDVIFFGGFFKALQNIPVTLNSILKSTDQSVEDYEYLKLAIAEVENLNTIVDRVHGNAIDQRRVIRFSRQLILSSGSNSSTVGYVNIKDDGSHTSAVQDKLNLRLNEKSRKLIKCGTVFKKRDLWLENSQVYLVLLDNYLLITEVVSKSTGTKFRLTERPIPIDYLSLEAREDFNLTKYTSGGVSSPEQSHLGAKEVSEGYITPVKTSRPNLPNSKSFSPQRSKSTQNMSPITHSRNDLTEHQDASTSFKIRNTATNESFTFSTHSLEERDDWVASFGSCFKSHHANNNSRVYALTCLTDMFSYEEGQAPTNLPVAHEGSAIAQAMRAYYGQNSPTEQSIEVDIRCTVRLPFEGRIFTLCAVNHGVYMTFADDYHQWKKVLSLTKITRMQVNTRLNILFVLADRRLCYFNIPSIICAYYSIKDYLHLKQLTGVLLQEKVGFFKMADDFGNLRQLFFERKGKIVVLTPEFDRLTKKLKFFKIYKEYRLPSSTNGLLSADIKDIVVFAKSFIVCSSKGALLFNESFNDEGLFLPSFHNDKAVMRHKQHFPHHPFKSQKEALSKTNSSKQKMAGYVKTDIINRKTASVGCFQLSDNDFIVIYDEAVVRINKNAEIPDWTSDMLVLDFFCLAASFTDEFLILFGENLVQVYDLNYAGIISNDKLSRLTPVQIIKGKKIKMVSSDRTEPPTMILSHPSIPGRQLVLEFNRET
ncbi:LANO_0G12684g1_1 [Lachancea nothofagi CBS 11611]|uniref:LANO_0G12684g1_1 n=1 Tax=Lachancea nothofagi CBS 11611 TaxID=1266666 RepID=A0A1G4KK52_9SACH|nr:LANO_0G12684g1_1 [Lachancea nothofagi CBS 11611]